MSDLTGPGSLEQEYPTPTWVTPRQRGSKPALPLRAVPGQGARGVEGAGSAQEQARAAAPGQEPVQDAVPDARPDTAPDTAPDTGPQAGPPRVRQSVAPAEELARTAHWRGNRSGRGVGLVILAAAVAGVVISASRATMGDSDQAVGLLLVFSFLTILLYAVLTATTPLDVDLRGSRLTVRDSEGTHRFDLTNPFQEVILEGTPDSPSWRLILGLPDRRSITLRRRHVDPAVLHPVVVAARTYAERGRRERQERFSR